MSANKYKVLTLSSLKWIALITMLIDHIAATMMPYRNIVQKLTNINMAIVYAVMRGIGRLSFPIFCFCIVEGFVHTRNVKKYLIRLFIFALITEPIYDLAFFGRALYLDYQNVLWTFLISMLMLMAVKKYSQSILLKVIIILIFALIAWLLKTDYSYIGVIIVAIYYLYREKNWVKLGATAILFLDMAVIGAALTCLYNGEKGKGLKYLFYVFYPAHLLLLYIISSNISDYLKVFTK